MSHHWQWAFYDPADLENNPAHRCEKPYETFASPKYHVIDNWRDILKIRNYMISLIFYVFIVRDPFYWVWDAILWPTVVSRARGEPRGTKSDNGFFGSCCCSTRGYILLPEHRYWLWVWQRSVLYELKTWSPCSKDIFSATKRHDLYDLNTSVFFWKNKTFFFWKKKTFFFWKEEDALLLEA